MLTSLVWDRLYLRCRQDIQVEMLSRHLDIQVWRSEEWSRMKVQTMTKAMEVKEKALGEHVERGESKIGFRKQW